MLQCCMQDKRMRVHFFDESFVYKRAHVIVIIDIGSTSVNFTRIKIGLHV